MTLNEVRRGAGRPLIVLHGGGLDHAHMLDAVEPAFDGVAGWERIYLDLPGHGLSPGDGIESQDDVLAAVAQHADALGQPVAVLGESRGSTIAHGLAMSRPDSLLGVALIAPGGNLGTHPVPPPTVIVTDTETAETLAPEVRARFDKLAIQSPEMAEKILSVKFPAAARADKACAARVAQRFHLSLEEAPFARPSLIVAGRQDCIAGWEEAMGMASLYPRASVVTLDCASHSLSWERPAIFAALVRDWLDRM